MAELSRVEDGIQSVKCYLYLLVNAQNIATIQAGLAAVRGWRGRKSIQIKITIQPNRAPVAMRGCAGSSPAKQQFSNFYC